MLQYIVVGRFFKSRIMTPSKKAIELYEMFYFAPDEDGFHSQNKYRAKVQATLCCSEIIKLIKESSLDGGNTLKWWGKVVENISKL